MKKPFIISAAILCLCSAEAWGQNLGELLHKFTYQARIGYNLGGTAPIGMPATIRTPTATRCSLTCCSASTPTIPWTTSGD